MKEQQKIWMSVAVIGLFVFMMFYFGGYPSMPPTPENTMPFGMATELFASQSEFFKTESLPLFMNDKMRPSSIDMRISSNMVPVGPNSSGQLTITVDDELIAPFGLIMRPPFHYSVYWFEGADPNNWIKNYAKTSLQFNSAFDTEDMLIAAYSCRKDGNSWDCNDQKWQYLKFKLYQGQCTHGDKVCSSDKKSLMVCNDLNLYEPKYCTSSKICSDDVLACVDDVPLPPPPPPPINAECSANNDCRLMDVCCGQWQCVPSDYLPMHCNKMCTNEDYENSVKPSGCDCSSTGKCKPVYLCPTEVSPVCGVDGITYDNGCLAAANGAVSWTQGKCNAVVECKDYFWYDNNNIDCNKKQFCGDYMYYGLHTFDSKSACEESVMDNPLIECPVYWWFDNNLDDCQQDKFCGAYQYDGLQTFANQPTCQGNLEHARNEQNIQCENVWFYDNDQDYCSVMKDCGLVMYEGLKMFDSVEDCKDDLNGCKTLWYYDNTHDFCQEQKFCGNYMYPGLRTFQTESACDAGLNSQTTSSGLDPTIVEDCYNAPAQYPSEFSFKERGSLNGDELMLNSVAVKNGKVYQDVNIYTNGVASPTSKFYYFSSSDTVACMPPPYSGAPWMCVDEGHAASGQPFSAALDIATAGQQTKMGENQDVVRTYRMNVAGVNSYCCEEKSYHSEYGESEGYMCFHPTRHFIMKSEGNLKKPNGQMLESEYEVLEYSESASDSDFIPPATSLNPGSWY